jgi:preprotein translocase subunit YajC
MTLATLIAATSTKSSGSSYILPLLLVVFAAVYFLVLRPRQKKAQQAARTGKTFEIGDDVVTIGGVCGTVISMDDDKVVLATGLLPGDSGEPGTVTHLTFLRQAIAKKVELEPEETEDWPSHDESHDEGHDDTGDQGGSSS